MSALRRVLELNDLDQLRVLAGEAESRDLLARAGLRLGGAQTLDRERNRLRDGLDRHWLGLYERSLARYGRGVTPVRERVCQGCFVTLPTSAAPPAGTSELHTCESCGRLLYWR